MCGEAASFARRCSVAPRLQHVETLKVAITAGNAGGMVVNTIALEEKRAEEREIKK